MFYLPKKCLYGTSDMFFVVYKYVTRTTEVSLLYYKGLLTVLHMYIHCLCMILHRSVHFTLGVGLFTAVHCSLISIDIDLLTVLNRSVHCAK